MSKPTRSRLITIIRIVAQVALGVGIVAYLVWANHAELLGLWQQPKRWGFMLAGLLITLGAILLTFLRWYLLIWAQGLPFGVRDGLRIGFIGYLFNQLIPGAVSGDLVKAVLLAREQERRTVAISTVVIDRIVGMYALALVAGLASLVFWRNLRDEPTLRTIGMWVMVVVGVGTLGFGMLFTPLLYRGRWVDRLGRLPVGGGLIREVLSAMGVYHSKQRVVLLAVAMSVLVHLGLVSALYSTAWALKSPPWSVETHYLMAPVGLTINAIPLTPGGVGVGEGAMQELFKRVGEDGATALAMMFAWRVMCWIIALIGVPYFINSFAETRKAIAAAEPTAAAAPPLSVAETK